LNDLVQDAEKAAEIMHPKREMWIRFIRALRLAEYSQKPGFEALKTGWMCFTTKTMRCGQEK